MSFLCRFSHLYSSHGIHQINLFELSINRTQGTSEVSKADRQPHLTAPQVAHLITVCENTNGITRLPWKYHQNRNLTWSHVSERISFIYHNARKYSVGHTRNRRARAQAPSRTEQSASYSLNSGEFSDVAVGVNRRVSISTLSISSPLISGGRV